MLLSTGDIEGTLAGGPTIPFLVGVMIDQINSNNYSCLLYLFIYLFHQQLIKRKKGCTSCYIIVNKRSFDNEEDKMETTTRNDGSPHNILYVLCVCCN
jgi:hypothetical protein